MEASPQGFKGSLIRNISEGGILMRSYEFLPLNLKLVVELPLMSAVRPVEGACRVAWVNKRGFDEQFDVGVEFVNLNQGDSGRLSSFIKSVQKVA